MKIAIMQPYFMPYMGYWQLMNVVDKYIIYDDVNYIKHGWINRNRILINGEPAYFHIPIVGGSQNKLINQIEVNSEERLIRKCLRTIELAYKRAPFFTIIYTLMEKIMFCNKDNISEYIIESLQVVCDYLDIRTELIASSTINKDVRLKAQDKIVSICKIIGATEYYNPIGGMELYSFTAFRKNGIKLKFLKMNDIKYQQFGNAFQRDLSIIDVMMFNSKEEIRKMLNDFIIITD